MHKLRLYILLLFTSLSTLGAVQHATICKFELRPSKAITGAASYDVVGTICFDHSMDDFRKAGDSLEKIYVLTIKFKEDTRAINVSPGYTNHYCDENGVIKLSKVQKLYDSNIYSYDFAFSIPIAAINLSEGKHTLIPLVSLTEGQGTRSLLRKEKLNPFIIEKPPVAKIRLWVKHILVDSLDADGSLWDYFIFNPIESNPDIVWSLKYAGGTYFSSKMVRNVFEYFDPHQYETYDLNISKGDTISIEVKDVDDLTPDDIIGTVIIPSENQTGKVVTAKAGQIKSIEYMVSILP